METITVAVVLPHLCDDGVTIVVLYKVLDLARLRRIQMVTANEMRSQVVFGGV